MTDTAIVYYWFRVDGGDQPHLDQHSPILPSIATARAYNPDVKIYVLSPQLERWGNYGRLLNFHIIHQLNQCPLPCPDWMVPIQYGTTCRLWDVYHFAQQIPERYVIYVDSDMFFRADPVPQQTIVGVQTDDRGAGYFRFDKKCVETEVFFQTWMGLVLAGMLMPWSAVKQRISGYHAPMFWDETSLIIMLRHKMNAGWSFVPREENYFPDTLDEPINLAAKALHAHSGLFGSDRLRVAQRVREFNDAIRRVLPPEKANELLGDVVPDLDFDQLARLGSDTFW